MTAGIQRAEQICLRIGFKMLTDGFPQVQREDHKQYLMLYVQQ